MIAIVGFLLVVAGCAALILLAFGDEAEGNQAMLTATYYVMRAADGFLELRQTRFIGRRHPHDVCAVARDRDEMKNMIDKHFDGTVDWSRLD